MGCVTPGIWVVIPAAHNSPGMFEKPNLWKLQVEGEKNARAKQQKWKVLCRPKQGIQQI
jgi:hypothetical protein